MCIMLDVLVFLAGLGACASQAPRPAHARAVGPVSFTAKWGAFFNRHARGHSFASDRSIRSTVQLRLLPKGRARATDRGERKHSSMSRYSGYQGETTRWALTWQGTWRRTRGGLVLRLQLKKHRCQKLISRRRPSATLETQTRKACPAPPPTLALRCEAARVQAQPSMSKASSVTTEPAWRCAPTGGALQTGGSPSPWVFGTHRCLKSIGLMRLAYEKCGKPYSPGSGSSFVIYHSDGDLLSTPQQ